jgi:hypothetical protein
LWKNIDEEKRRLSAENGRIRHALKQLREGKRKLAEELKQAIQSIKFWEKKCEEERKKREELEKRVRELERQRDRYRDMIFKPNVKKEEEVEEGEESKGRISRGIKRKPGGQKGHKGYGRKRPIRVDEEKRIYLERCPDCDCKLKRSNTTKSHTVEDIPGIEQSVVKAVKYRTEVQWCPGCRKVVKGRALGVIPRSRLGVNVLLYVLIHKYICREPWETIVFNLSSWYGLHVSKGSLVAMMHRARKWMGSRYTRLLEQIRAAAVKYADETSWRLDGINHWLWGFFTDKHAYYTIEESRGKKVPQEVLADSHPKDVLVRDDYAGYMKLPLLHQSCWRHLLAVSHENAVQPDVSPEMVQLHEKLKSMFSSLQKIVESPFDLRKRKIAHKIFKERIQRIIDTSFQHDDSTEIHTRISNQNTNLITALLHRNVPLTNNHSERNIRCFVVARKISGGSRSRDGAKTNAVIMSIVQTIRLQKKPIITTLKEYLLSSHFSKTE